MAVAARGCPQRSGRSRPGRGPSAAHRELGKHPRVAHRGPLMQLSRHGDGLLLSVNDRCRPMLRARRGHGRRGRRCSKPTGNGRQLDRRARAVLGDHLPRWQGSTGVAAAVVLALSSSTRATWSPPGGRLRLRRPVEQTLQLSGPPAESGVIRLAGNDAVANHGSSFLRPSYAAPPASLANVQWTRGSGRLSSIAATTCARKLQLTR
jgi:hypothetical protein